MMNKKMLVLYPFNKKWHTLYDSTLDLFKKNYNIFYNPQENKNWITPFIYYAKMIYPLRYFYHRFIRKFVNIHKFQKKDKIPEEYASSLVFASNCLPPEGHDFIIDLEIITSLTGYDYEGLDKDYIKKRLEDSKCKAIICYNQSSYETLTKTINCSKFDKKIHIVPFAVGSDKIKKNFNKADTRLLFTSSANNPQDFEVKGGLIALETYKELINKGVKNISLTIRANVPKKIQSQYKNFEGIKFIDEFLDEKQMKDLFIDSDILLEPVPGINLMLECMNFQMPVIAFDYWCIPEMVINGKTGYTIDSSSLFGRKNNMKIYLKDFHLNYLRLFKFKKSKPLIKEFAEKTEKLILDKKLRQKMAIESKRLLNRDGKFSLSKRNELLLGIINSALE